MQRIRVTNAPEQKIGVDNTYRITVGSAPPYEGEYVITPTQERQVLETKNMTMTDNVTVEPIPKNYGLITYNGFELTVS